DDTIRERVLNALIDEYKKKEDVVGAQVLRQFEKTIMLQSLDMHWKDHLAAMDHLRQGIHLRGYAQKNPKQEYKREAFELFAEMLEALKLEVISILSKVQVRAQEEVDAIEEKRRAADAAQTKEFQRSEERRVGNECRSRWSQEH